MPSAMSGIAVSDASPLQSLLWEKGFTINREKAGFLAAEFRGRHESAGQSGLLDWQTHLQAVEFVRDRCDGDGTGGMVAGNAGAGYSFRESCHHVRPDLLDNVMGIRYAEFGTSRATD